MPILFSLLLRWNPFQSAHFILYGVAHDASRRNGIMFKSQDRSTLIIDGLVLDVLLTIIHQTTSCFGAPFFGQRRVAMNEKVLRDGGTHDARSIDAMMM